ncbi:molybdopterin-synthase adenylyltransferase MoeB [Chromatium okenii]|uniref:HesA/MoeB/ThiF family protein n=1 Tax=Chromatium okenii TaxID=61644 RepID=UPI001903C95B|nr:HesA/MoeB/ThiF family protein [Chromatium okenii]MBK1641833.1 molybdopterin-synthase adenylyltransferase MoeB [Chromatium okenii]
MTDDQLLRYSRQMLLPSLGVAGQQRLAAARVLIVGLGGLGSPVAMYLAAAGVGRLLLADGDHVDLSNLHRQILHPTAHVGLTKTESARRTLAALNPDVELIPLATTLTAETLPQWVTQVDVVLDCSDNFATRFAINAACNAARVPLISGAALRLEGQVTAFSGQPGDPCYRCLFPDGADYAGDTCATNGILPPLVGIIGGMQATEALKLLTGIGTPLFGRLLLLDVATMSWRSLRLRADPACPVCGQRRLN